MQRSLLRRGRAAGLALLAVAPLTALGVGSAPTAGAAITTDQIPAYYASHGGAGGAYGPALTEEFAAAGGGREQVFAHGTILWSPLSGTHGLTGPYQAKFVHFGGVAALGYPRTEVLASHVVDGSHVDFTRGAIFSWRLDGNLLTYALTHTAAHYESIHGYGSGRVGPPHSDEFPLVVNGTVIGTEVLGTHGHLYWSPRSGAHEVHGAILHKWGVRGGVTGQLGFPTSDLGWLVQDDILFNSFQGGDIFLGRMGSGRPHAVLQPFLRYWQLRHHSRRPSGGYGFGNALGDAVQVIPNYVVQEFEHGTIVYKPIDGTVSGYLI